MRKKLNNCIEITKTNVICSISNSNRINKSVTGVINNSTVEPAIDFRSTEICFLQTIGHQLMTL